MKCYNYFILKRHDSNSCAANKFRYTFYGILSVCMCVKYEFQQIIRICLLAGRDQKLEQRL